MYFFEFKMPGKIVCVDGGASKLGKTVTRLGGTRVLIVTDPGVRKAGLVDTVASGIESADVKVAGVFGEVGPDPGVKTIVECAAMAQDIAADCVVSIGGGSSIDTAKATLIQLCEGGDLLDYEWNEYFASSTMLPHIAIPTTAGTGSESTHVAMVTDDARQRKLMYQGGDLLPKVAILDPRMTLSLPPKLTAATGMDAMTHAIESMHSVWHQPMTDGLAMQGIGLVNTFLPRVFADGQDGFGRMNMLMAATIGGISVSNSFICIVHAAAHPIGAMFHVPHGIAVGVMLPYAMEMNLKYEGVPAIYKKVACSLDLKVESDDDMTAARKAIEHIRGLIASLELPSRLSDLGIKQSDFEPLADEIMEDKAIMVTPGNPGRDDIMGLIHAAF